MLTRRDELLIILAALFALFTPMIDPRVSTTVAVAVLAAYMIYCSAQNRTHHLK